MGDERIGTKDSFMERLYANLGRTIDTGYLQLNQSLPASLRVTALRSKESHRLEEMLSQALARLVVVDESLRDIREQTAPSTEWVAATFPRRLIRVGVDMSLRGNVCEQTATDMLTSAEEALASGASITFGRVEYSFDSEMHVLAKMKIRKPAPAPPPALLQAAPEPPHTMATFAEKLCAAWRRQGRREDADAWEAGIAGTP